MDGRTDGRTDQRTDIPSYRDARTHLKRNTITEQKVFCQIPLSQSLFFSLLFSFDAHQSKSLATPHGFFVFYHFLSGELCASLLLFHPFLLNFRPLLFIRATTHTESSIVHLSIARHCPVHGSMPRLTDQFYGVTPSPMVRSSLSVDVTQQLFID